MPRDNLFQDLASRWPDAVLALVRRRGRALYRGRGEVLVVDGTLSQVDMVFRPTTGRLATVMAEMQRRDDPQCERKFLRKVLAERSRGSAAARIAPYMLYAQERVRARALTADIPAEARLGDDGLGMFLRLMADRFSDRSCRSCSRRGGSA